MRDRSVCAMQIAQHDACACAHAHENVHVSMRRTLRLKPAQAAVAALVARRAGALLMHAIMFSGENGCGPAVHLTRARQRGMRMHQAAPRVNLAAAAAHRESESGGGGAWAQAFS